MDDRYTTHQTGKARVESEVPAIPLKLYSSSGAKASRR